MKVALVTHWLSKTGGGISAAVEDLSRALAMRGTAVTVFGLDDVRWEENRKTWAGAPAQAFPIVGPNALGLAPRLRTALRTGNFDLAHLHGLWMHTSADVLACSRGRPFLVSPHGMLDPWAVARSAAKKRFVRLLYEDRLLRTAACIHALNSAEAAAVRAFGLKNPICVIPNGVMLPEPGPKPPAPWVKVFGADARVLLFLGRLHPKKNVHGLVNSIAILKTQKVLGDWRLAIAGWDQGGYGERLAADVEARGLAGEIAFLGSLFGVEKDAALRNASAFVLPSFSEGLPMAVLEAWAHGLPVAMTAACNLPEGFEADAALEVRTAPEPLAAVLSDLFATPPQSLERMGAAGRALVESHYSWDAVVGQVLEVYAWLAGGGAKPCSVERTGLRA